MPEASSMIKIKNTTFFLFLIFYFFQTGVLLFFKALVIRSYHGESTASHPNCEVKHRWAGSVLW